MRFPWEVARLLMDEYILVVGRIEYRIVECEVYCFNTQHHPDPYCHHRKEQLTPGQWYFNDFGLDLTFGKPGTYASILIRGIRQLSSGEYISGSSSVVRELFTSQGSAFADTGGIWIKEKGNAEFDQRFFVATARVNLPAKEDDPDDFRSKPYRFIVELVPEHKFAGKERVVRNLGVNSDEAGNILGYKPSNI